MDAGERDLLEICSNMKPVRESERQNQKEELERQEYEFSVSLVPGSSRA